MQLPTKSDPIFHLDRYRKIISILIKYGFSDFVSHSALQHLVPENPNLVPTREGKSIFEMSRAERVRLAAEELGVTFIKFGQILSNRPDIVPDDLIEEFEKFQNNVPAISGDEIKKVLEKEYEQPLEELFREIDFEPLAAASIAQVHRAWLPDGSPVVLKVQRPGLRKQIESDIEIIRQLAGFAAERFPEIAAVQPLQMLKVFERAIMRELKFTGEMANIQRFQRNFKGHPDLYVPKVYPELSNMHILCMEFIEGVKITNLDALAALGIDRADLALRGINLYFEMVFDHGFFHADPHAGNMFVLENGKVCLIDFGMMGTVIEEDKLLLGDLMLAMATRDVKKMKSVVLQFSSDPERIGNIRQLEYDIIDFFQEYSSYGIDDFEGEDVMDGLNVLLFEYKFRIPPNMMLLLKALMMVQGIGLTLDPRYNIIKNMEPYIQKLLSQRYNPQKMLSETIDRAKNLDYLTSGLPEDIRAVVNKVKEGKLHIEYEVTGLDETHKNLKVITNRISFTIILASIIIGSALVIHAKVPPEIWGISGIGLGGLGIAGVFSLWLLYRLWKQRNE